MHFSQGAVRQENKRSRCVPAQPPFISKLRQRESEGLESRRKWQNPGRSLVGIQSGFRHIEIEPLESCIGCLAFDSRPEAATLRLWNITPFSRS